MSPHLHNLFILIIYELLLLRLGNIEVILFRVESGGIEISQNVFEIVDIYLSRISSFLFEIKGFG